MEEYSEEIFCCSQWIKNGKFEKVCIQLPDYMLCKSVSISSEFERLLAHRVYILGDTSYGSCCVDETAAQHIAADCIIHFGRSCLTPNSHLPVYYVLPKQPLDDVQCANSIIKTFETDEGLVLVLYDVAYHHVRDHLAKSLAPAKSIILSDIDLKEQNTTSCTVSDGQEYTCIFGRQFPNLNYKNIVYIVHDNYMNNVDRFILEKKECQVYIYQNSCNILTQRSLSSVIKKKNFTKEKIKDSTHIGILICSLSIKDLLERINRVKCLCKKTNKKCYIFSVGRPNVAKLANFPEIEIFVNITCAEGVIENQKEYMQPIVNIDDIELALGTDYSSYLPDMSLVTNKLRNITMPNEEIELSSALNVRTDMSLSMVTQNRTWTGLNPHDTRPPVIIATEGRKGTPSSGYITSDSDHRS
ncbi:2-(3-amino-3-carboxypropyl)histidine synthase subunit 2 isoform X1 [Acyrthosiphon pisum]|uniref:2-(3-amino-3-carboxypropyl)histidine synthase subunit 2 n=1 Tax=Acyrthosiphon pisum TaxID=7029 RepID=A0A8R2FBR0_ACYPI|nr:2-(3-amino-3-carboxypropyl)histidine synthase subunit 2 isoform X1 [Acyrthosiphon pisum]|eukprot:XP_008187718.1 PREDICTED: diphthamide biosynthesis protein 2 isoform X1 [Acyrthosiphon pisum]